MDDDDDDKFLKKKFEKLFQFFYFFTPAIVSPSASFFIRLGILPHHTFFFIDRLRSLQSKKSRKKSANLSNIFEKARIFLSKIFKIITSCSQFFQVFSGILHMFAKNHAHNFFHHRAVFFASDHFSFCIHHFEKTQHCLINFFIVVNNVKIFFSIFSESIWVFRAGTFFQQSGSHGSVFFLFSFFVFFVRFFFLSFSFSFFHFYFFLFFFYIHHFIDICRRLPFIPKDCFHFFHRLYRTLSGSKNRWSEKWMKEKKEKKKNDRKKNDEKNENAKDDESKKISKNLCVLKKKKTWKKTTYDEITFWNRRFPMMIFSKIWSVRIFQFLFFGFLLMRTSKSGFVNQWSMIFCIWFNVIDWIRTFVILIT